MLSRKKEISSFSMTSPLSDSLDAGAVGRRLKTRACSKLDVAAEDPIETPRVHELLRSAWPTNQKRQPASPQRTCGTEEERNILRSILHAGGVCFPIDSLAFQRPPSYRIAVPCPRTRLSHRSSCIFYPRPKLSAQVTAKHVGRSEWGNCAAEAVS